jgi:NAD(P)-dependent dehydrogenase (short-subunit alcohol dehydrogenase family)
MPSGLDVTGRRTLVTGGAGGIGRAVAEAFAAADAHVAVADLDQAACQAVVDGLSRPREHVAIGVDLVDISGHRALLERASEHLGGLDVLAHLAAVLRRRASLEDVTEEDWDAQLDLNLKATFFLNRAVAGFFRAQGTGGRIINFTSQGWWTGGFGGSVVYNASKGAVVTMSRGLARSLAADGITVNTVAPGAVDTAMMRSGMTDAALADFVKMIPMGRMAEPAEITGAVLFLASEAAGYVTGATINVTGGQLMY